MYKVNKCCFCLSVPTGVLAIGAFNWLVTQMHIGLCMYLGFEHFDYYIYGSYFLCGILDILAHISLIFGVYKKDNNFLLVYLIERFLWLVLDSAIFAFLARYYYNYYATDFEEDDFNKLVLVCVESSIVLATGLYFWMMVIFLYLEQRHEHSESPKREEEIE